MFTCCLPGRRVNRRVHALDGASCFPWPAKCCVYGKDTGCLQLKTGNQNMKQDTVMSCSALAEDWLVVVSC